MTVSTPTACDDCPYAQCKASRKRVAFYLLVWRQATLHGEPFEVMLRHRTRKSRLTDPHIRSASFASDEMTADARATGWALDEIAREHTWAFMHPANAAAVANILCPERWQESE